MKKYILVCFLLLQGYNLFGSKKMMEFDDSNVIHDDVRAVCGLEILKQQALSFQTLTYKLQKDIEKKYVLALCDCKLNPRGISDLFDIVQGKSRYDSEMLIHPLLYIKRIAECEEQIKKYEMKSELFHKLAGLTRYFYFEEDDVKEFLVIMNFVKNSCDALSYMKQAFLKRMLLSWSIVSEKNYNEKVKMIRNALVQNDKFWIINGVRWNFQDIERVQSVDFIKNKDIYDRVFSSMELYHFKMMYPHIVNAEYRKGKVVFPLIDAIESKYRLGLKESYPHLFSNEVVK